MWGWRNKATANFYLAPTRAWELFAGSIAAFVVQKQGVQKNNPLALVGLAAIVFSIFFYDETTPFPSLYALVPVIGALMVVLYADTGTFAARLLSTKGFVGIGLISYSAYLWHFPIFAFQNIIWLEHQALRALISISFVFFLAYLSFRFIEKPFRNKRMPSAFVFKVSIISIVFFIIIGFVGHQSEGFKGRFNSDYPAALYTTLEQSNSSCKKFFPELYSSFECALTHDEPNPSIAVVGDSHSLIVYESLQERLPDSNIIRLKLASCFPFVSSDLLKSKANNCFDSQKLLKEFLKKNKNIEVVILSGYWGYLISGGFSDRGTGWRIHEEIGSADAQTFIKNATAFFEEASLPSRSFYLMQDVPDLDFSPVRCSTLAVPVPRFGKPRCTMRYENYYQRQIAVERVLNRVFVTLPNVRYVKTTHHFCNNNLCFSRAGEVDLYSDGDHLTKAGGDLVVLELIKSMGLLELGAD